MSNRSETHQYNKLATVLILLAMLMLFTAAVSPLSPIYINGGIVLIGFICFIYSFFYYRDKKVVVFSVGLLCWMTVSMLIAFLFNSNSSFGEILWNLAYIGIALCLYCFRINDKFVSLLYYVIIVFLLSFAVRGISSADVFNGSQNIASAVTLILLSINYYVMYKNLNRVVIFPAILQLLVSIWGIGRAGIISSIALILILVLLKSKKNLLGIFKIGILIFGLYYLSTMFFGEYIYIILDRFSSQGLKSSRIYIYIEYISGVQESISYLIFGVPYTYGEYLSYYKNPHNSFLELHSKYGFLGFIPIVYLLIQSFRVIAYQKKTVLVAIYIALMIRSFLDWTSFPGAYDIMWYIFIFFYFSRVGKNVD